MEQELSMWLRPLAKSTFLSASEKGSSLSVLSIKMDRFTAEVPDYAGLFVKDADKEIIRRLKSEDKVFHQATIRHRYPFCWRSDTPLIYKAVSTWFVAVEKIKDKLLEANEQIHWVPEHIKEGRFGKWLENARDWAISPQPILGNADSSLAKRRWRARGDLAASKSWKRRPAKKIIDLHRHFIDDLTFSKNGKVFKRIPEVFDCWFESGSMPYAQNHYPFENKEETFERLSCRFHRRGDRSDARLVLYADRSCRLRYLISLRLKT